MSKYHKAMKTLPPETEHYYLAGALDILQMFVGNFDVGDHDANSVYRLVYDQAVTLLDLNNHLPPKLMDEADDEKADGEEPDTVARTKKYRLRFPVGHKASPIPELLICD